MNLMPDQLLPLMTLSYRLLRLEQSCHAEKLWYNVNIVGLVTKGGDRVKCCTTLRRSLLGDLVS